jgi:hemerythrin-like domain-containing protein
VPPRRAELSAREREQPAAGSVNQSSFLAQKGPEMIREMLGIAEGILQDLHNDHGEVDTLLGRIMDCENGGERARLFSEMTHKLLPHLEAEQQVLYRRLETGKEEESRKFGLEGTSEHRIVEQQIDKIIGIGDTMSERWTAELKVLQDLIEHHVGEEESTGFSCARSEFDKEQLEAMSREFQTRKAQIATRVA